MSLFYRAIALVLVASVLSLEPLLAQSMVSASAEIAVGVGKGVGGEYVDRSMPTMRFTAGARFRQTRTTGVFAELSVDWLDRGHKLSCPLNSSGQCIPWYPGLTGVAATSGVVRRPSATTEFRLGAGAGFYSPTQEPRTAKAAMIGQVDVAVLASHRVWLTAGARAIVLPAFRGNLLAFIPATVGLRVR